MLSIAANITRNISYMTIVKKKAKQPNYLETIVNPTYLMP